MTSINESACKRKKVEKDELNESTWWTVDHTQDPPLTRGATPLVNRCIRMFGWSEAFCMKVLCGYKLFLALKVSYEDWDATQLSPSIYVDKMWHLHILDTRNYSRDCELLCGRFIHHDPNGGLDVTARKARIENTKSALVAKFGSEYDTQVWDFAVVSDGNTHLSQQSEGDSKIVVRIENASGEQRRFEVKRTMRFHMLYEAYAFQEFCHRSDLSFYVDRRSITYSDTAITLGLNDNAVIHVRSMVLIVCVVDMMGEQLFFRIKRTTEFRVVYHEYAVRKGWNREHIFFIVDGQDIADHHTAIALGLNDEQHLIHAIYRRQAGC